METVFKYRGRHLTAREVAFIRELIADHPTASRRGLSKELCQVWNWVQPNGALRDLVCRSLMLELHRAGLIEEHHYLGYTQPVGEHLKFLVLSHERPVACFVFSSAPRHLGPRDRYIGWNAQARRCNIRFIAYNSRFLILPWVRVPHLASHLLGRMARLLPAEWERVYGHPVYFIETFVDPSRYRGTCYRAANWVYLGQTTGRGKDAPTRRPNRPLKDVLGYPLTRQFRELLGRAG